MRGSNTILRIKEDEQVNMRKTSLLELNGINMSYYNTKKAIINELRSTFFLLKDL